MVVRAERHEGLCRTDRKGRAQLQDRSITKFRGSHRAFNEIFEMFKSFFNLWESNHEIKVLSLLNNPWVLWSHRCIFCAYHSVGGRRIFFSKPRSMQDSLHFATNWMCLLRLNWICRNDTGLPAYSNTGYSDIPARVTVFGPKKDLLILKTIG